MAHGSWLMAHASLLMAHDSCLTSGGSLIYLPLLSCVQAYNVAGFFVSIVPSLIYSTLVATPRDCGMLGPLLLRAVGYICAVTLCKSTMSVAQSSAALIWRAELTAHIHSRYVHRGAHYHLQLLSPSVDNPDQRIATELELWSTALAALLVSLSQCLFNILFYSLQTYLIMGWQARLY